MKVGGVFGLLRFLQKDINMYGKNKKEKMMSGGMAKKKMMKGGRVMYKDGGMAKAKPC
tara:strand:+ start:6359 stop:6532 length:174 start_codon:yes stop_codon:yes gene_type:complete